jgi:hypothetical protein
MDFAKTNKTLAIGERFNQNAWRPVIVDPDSFELRRRMGFYNRGPRLKMLQDLGVRWDDGINLLLPSPLPGEWDAVEARRVANLVSRHVLAYRYVLLFGQRVCAAFGIPWAPCQFVPASELGEAMIGYRTEFVPLPHPSGRCRMWNDPDVRALVTKTMQLMTDDQ